MNFLTSLRENPFILYDGPMETRIEYDSPIQLDKDVSIFKLIYQKEGKEILAKFYQTDIEIAGYYRVPILLNAPTWRASLNHINRAGYQDEKYVEIINNDCIQFVNNIRKKYPQQLIFITAPIGPKLIDYQYDSTLTINEATKYHELQAMTLAKSGVDIISIAAMPGSIETIGCAKAMAKTGLPYSVGVILNKDGTLLDGSPFKDLITRLDNTVSPAPNFYIISCTHATNAMLALSDNDPAYKRILGIKANGSSKPIQTLLNAGVPISDKPDVFADTLSALGKQHHFKLYGGCCGTDHHHLEKLAQKLKLINSTS